MVQVPADKQSSLDGWRTLLHSLFLSSRTNYTGMSASIVGSTVPVVNPPTACPSGKVPSAPVASTCVCAPGYQTSSAQQCAPCTVNTFKPAAGSADKCLTCPVGLGTNGATGATACTAPPPPTTAATTEDSSNTPVLIGAVAGGIVGLLLLLYILQAFLLPHNARH
jgi:hypothetical protein